MSTEKKHYDYIRIPVTPDQRAHLEDLIAQGKATTKAGAALLMFGSPSQTPEDAYTAELKTYIAEVCKTNGLLARLITGGILPGESTDAVLYMLQVRLSGVVRHNAKAWNTFRRAAENGGARGNP